MVRFGRTVDKGSLPVFSVETEDDARALIAFACPMTHHGEYYARELAQSQTLENLAAFSDRLAKSWDLIKASRNKVV